MRLHRRSRWVLAALLAAGHAMLAASAGATDLEDVISSLYGGDGITLSRAFGHDAHFTGESLEQLSELNDAIRSSLNVFSPTSTTAGFTFDTEQGVFVRTTESLGPIVAERPQTVGKGKLNFGLSYTHVDYDRFEGDELDDIELAFEHIDCCFGPGLTNFELDRVLIDIDLDITQDILAFSSTFGLTSHWDVSLLVPYIWADVDADAEARAEFNSAAGPIVHVFDPLTADSPVSSTGAKAAGIGDIVARTKYHFLRPDDRWTPDVSAIGQVRFPSGDEDDLLGLGEYALAGWLVAEKGFGVVSPHVNVGYEVLFDNAELNNLRWIAGADFRVHPRATLALDFLGRHELHDEDGIGDDQTDFSAGVKVNPFKTLVLSTNAILPLNEDSGLRADVIWSVGIEYTFN